MALNANQIPVYAISPRNDVGTLNAATAGALGTTTNAVTVYTASASGSRITSLIASSDDSAAVNVFVMLVDSDGTTIKPLGIVTVTANAGNSASVANIDLIDSLNIPGMGIDASGKRYFDMEPNETLRISCLANMTAAKKCHVTALGADYE